MGTSNIRVAASRSQGDHRDLQSSSNPGIHRSDLDCRDLLHENKKQKVSMRFGCHTVDVSNAEKNSRLAELLCQMMSSGIGC
jgi:hypothetical protein